MSAAFWGIVCASVAALATFALRGFVLTLAARRDFERWLAEEREAQVREFEARHFADKEFEDYVEREIGRER
jgi:hypothetical protein